MISYRAYNSRTINLDGPDGNANILVGFARNMARQLSLPSEKIVLEMTNGDHLHLLKTFDRYFGDYVSLETENQEYAVALDLVCE